MSYKPKVLTVAEGGSGSTSQTAYAVLCGGTTSTGAFQSIASVGTATHVFKSNGAGALPSFQAASSSGLGIIFFSQNGAYSPTDGQIVYLVPGAALNALGTAGLVTSRFYIPQSGTITKCYGVFTVAGTLASGESSTFAIRLNNTTDTTVSSSILLSSATNSFSNTGLSISVSTGDYIDFKFTAATFATNPTNVYCSVTAYLT